jgi:hypothetical protein
MSANSHAIIAGVNKCGTTSVFRYLAQHPQVSASRVKETRYFVKGGKRIAEKCYTDYLEHFRKDEQNRLMLEASPTYFTSGAEIGKLIQGVLPSARIIVFLRNPIERLISYYRSTLVYDNYANEFIRGLDFSEFVDLAIDAAEADAPGGPRETEFRRAFEQGNYARHLRQFGGEFQENEIGYFFFEDLVANTRRTMMDVCEFLGIDSQFFETFVFSVENKTRTYRSKTIQKLGYQLNMQLEPFFNSRPVLRKFAQTVYRHINEERDSVEFEVDPKTMAKLTDYYQDDIIRLGRILRSDQRVGQLPAWLAP